MDNVEHAVAEVASAVQNDPSLSAGVKEMQYLHLSKPWVPGFRAVLIVPLRDGLERFLAAPAGEFEGMTLHVPSPEWWISHSRTSHPPSGRGCSVRAHTDFLTPEGASAEFAYFNLMRDGSLSLLGPVDFERECAFWKDAFPRGGGYTRNGAYGGPGGY